MSNISRRQALSVAGLTLGAGAFGLKMAGSQSIENTGKPRYVPISPQRVAELAYAIYPDGSCMYATIKSITSEVARKDATAVPSVPFDMFKYGHGGVGGWGTVCGTCNGGAAVIGLFHQDKKVRDDIIAELFRWYESTELPRFLPAGAEGKDFPQTVTQSVLCHVSVDSWCKEADREPTSKKRKDRCRRMTADMAGKVVELLNARHEAEMQLDEIVASDCKRQATCPPESCVQCHSGPSEKNGCEDTVAPKTIVKMNCATCHEMKSDHAK